VAAAVVPGRLGADNRAAPYVNPWGQGARCDDHCKWDLDEDDDSDEDEEESDDRDDDSDELDDGKDGDDHGRRRSRGYKSCKGYKAVVTIWR
jgi:hypothetical protein